MATHHHFKQTVNGETLAYTITRPLNQSASAPTILIIHGAGPSGQHRYTFLSEYLATQGHTSLRFDHSGHGESSGELLNSSLTKRLDEAKSFLPLLHPTAPLTVMGASMGGHIASRLLPYANFQSLIAQVPAAYTQRAESQSFGPEFTALIRESGSWVDATIWPELDKFTGQFLLISAENDTIIPTAVLEAYWHHTADTSRRQHLVLEKGEHSVSGWLTKNPEALPAYLSAIHNILPQ